mmetsp:Transcript_16911/g.39745  ORF Transcript_16911/g.39745 Transcript_16911/m.39745 type:complete len:98 (+) Transcript_16911:693-986(+)
MPAVRQPVAQSPQGPRHPRPRPPALRLGPAPHALVKVVSIDFNDFIDSLDFTNLTDSIHLYALGLPNLSPPINAIIVVTAAGGLRAYVQLWKQQNVN